MYDFDNINDGYELPWDIGGQAALNDFNRKLFNMFQSFESEDAAWADMRKSEFGAKLFEEITQFDEFEFNGSAKEGDDA